MSLVPASSPTNPSSPGPPPSLPPPPVPTVRRFALPSSGVPMYYTWSYWSPASFLMICPMTHAPAQSPVNSRNSDTRRRE